MIKTDLHIHSCLSPCADSAMTPRELVAAAREAGLGLIALTDHNSTRNCHAAAAEAAAAGIGFIPGLEVTTSEEIHCVCLFPDVGKAAAFSRWLDSLRPSRSIKPAIFRKGPGMVAAPRRFDEQELLFAARNISLEELPRAVRMYGGLLWPAHVDKPANSLYSILGCWPEGIEVDAVELYGERPPRDVPASLRQLRCSDAHRLWDIKKFGGFDLPLTSPDFTGLERYLKGL